MKQKNIIFSGIKKQSKILLTALFTISISVGAAFAAIDTSCDNENNEFINQRLALCSTHAYNIGMISNPTNEAERAAMNEVVALKTTIMTQQMKKQYDYLEATVKRFKTQLEKAILVAKMEAAGASTGASGSGSSSAGSNTTLVGTENCGGRSAEESISCLRRNFNEVNRAVTANKFADASKVVQQDIIILNGLINAYLPKESRIKPFGDGTNDTEISCHSRLTRSTAAKCLSDMNAAIMAIDTAMKKATQPAGRYYPG
jgi:hypothetical protein